MLTGQIRDYLKFYRDLGVTDLYMDLPGGRTDAAAADAQSSEMDAQARAAALQVIRDDIGECTRCRLHEGRNKIVFGSGNPLARVVFVGEAPGADEDREGLPFVGRAGKKLTEMIDGTCKSLGLSVTRKDVYICNVAKCRPPGNRNPKPDEMDMCRQFMERQIEAIQPNVICVLGAVAAKALLRTKEPIGKLRGSWQDWRGIPVMPTFHPSYVLRQYTVAVRQTVFGDLQKVFRRAYD